MTQSKRFAFSRLVRSSHRWISMAFTLTVIANFIALSMGQQIDVITYLPLVPLFLLLASGLYLFALPYFRATRRAG